MKPESLKLLEEKYRSMLQNIVIGEDFLNKTWNSGIEASYSETTAQYIERHPQIIE